ncbi:hypothetical protein ABPG75_001584 [Micractinium tetrahymenae]
MEQGNGGRQPGPQANGTPWQAGCLERTTGGEWAMLFPTGGAGTPTSAVAAFPHEVQAQQSLQLLRLHALLRANPALPLDQVPPELAAAMQPSPSSQPSPPPPRQQQQQAAMQQSPPLQPQGQQVQHQQQLKGLQEQQQRQQPAAPQQSNMTAASGDAGAGDSEYLGVRPAPGDRGGWLAEVSVTLDASGQPDPGGRRQQRAVHVATELEAALARDLPLVWQQAWCGPTSSGPLCNFPFKRYCQDAKLWAIFCELPSWDKLAAYLAQLQDSGFLLKAAQAYDAFSLPQGWPEPGPLPAGGAPPAVQHPASQQGDGEDRAGGGGGSAPSYANGQADGGAGELGGAAGGGGSGRPGAAGGRGTKRRAGGPPAAEQQGRQRSRPTGNASGYPGVNRCTKSGGWYGRVALPGRQPRFDVLRDHDAQVVAVGRELALFWVSLISPGQHQRAPHPALRDSFLADAELMGQLGTAKEAADMRKLVQQLQHAGRLRQWCHLLPPPLTGSQAEQQAGPAAPAAAAAQAEDSAGLSAAAAAEQGEEEEEEEPGSPGLAAALRTCSSAAALDALTALAAAAGASAPGAEAPAAQAPEGHRLPLHQGPPASQDAGAVAAARSGVVAAPLPEGWERRAAAWQQLSLRQADAWAGSVQPASLEILSDSWPGQRDLAAAQAAAAQPASGLPSVRDNSPAEAGAAAAAGAARSSPVAEAATLRRSHHRSLMRIGSGGQVQQAAGAMPAARAAAVGRARVPEDWQELAAAWQQLAQQTAERWEGEVPAADPSWLTDAAQLQQMVLPAAQVQPTAAAEPAASAALVSPGKLQHAPAPAEPDQQQPEGSATTACTVLVWQPAAQLAGGQAPASPGEASPTSPPPLQPQGAPSTAACLASQQDGEQQVRQTAPVTTPAGTLLASLPASATARLQFLLAGLKVEPVPEAEEAGGGGGASPPQLTQQQQAPQAAGGDVLLYCRKTSGLAGLPLLEKLLVVEARLDEGPSSGPKASQQHCECLLLASGPSEDHLSPPELLPPGASSTAAAAALGRVALVSRKAFKLMPRAVHSARQWRLVGHVPLESFSEVVAVLAPHQ